MHAEQVIAGSDNVYLTRTRTDASGNYTLHVPSDAIVELSTFRRGDTVVGPVEVAVATATADFTLTPTGTIQVTTTELGGGAIPARIQVLPAGSSVVPSVPGVFGEPSTVSGRLHVDYATGVVGGGGVGESSFRAPVGDWEVIVSRGPEWEIYREQVTVTDGGTVSVNATLEHTVDTTGVMCADFHVHTHRSNDSGDDVRIKIRSAVADGLEIPARSEHEYAELTDPVVLELGLGAYAYGLSSLELTTFEFYGHFGVIRSRPPRVRTAGRSLGRLTRRLRIGTNPSSISGRRSSSQTPVPAPSSRRSSSTTHVAARTTSTTSGSIPTRAWSTAPKIGTPSSK